MNFVFKKCINVNIEQGFITWKLKNVSIICTRLCLLPSSRDKKQLRLSGMKVSFYQTIHWFFFEKLQFVSIILECVCCPFRGKKQLRLLRIKGSFHKTKELPKKTWRSDGAKFSLPESGVDSSEDSKVTSTNHISIDKLPSVHCLVRLVGTKIGAPKQRK